MKKYIDDILNKNFIKLNTFWYVASILIIKKLDKKFRVCVDYKALNNFIIKNRNVFSLIKDTLTRLCKIKWYNKFDIIVVFNEIRIRESDEKKTIFLTRYELFGYVVIFFNFCNALETFQTFINVTLKKYLNDFCFEYLDDILIYNETRDDHVEHVFKVLKRLQKVDLFLNIDKCEFFVQEIKYLNLIITIDDIKMNLKKVETIMNWKVSRNLKNVQIFLEFANFYKKFIMKYFKLVDSLMKLIKITTKNFVYSWDFENLEKVVFNVLKQTFTTTSIFQHFDFDKKIWIENDVFDYVATIVLSQIKFDDKLHFIAFMFKRMFSTKCNYEIYDKKLLIIIKTFEKWRSKYANIFVENLIKVFIHHKNLKHFMTSTQLNRKQIHWIEFLFEFNFKITYKSNVQNTKSNNLTRRFANFLEFDDNDDERKKYNYVTLLKKTHLNKRIHNVVNLVVALLNETQKTIVYLVAIIYDFNEKSSFEKKKINEKSFTNVLEKNDEQKTIEKLIIDILNVQLEKSIIDIFDVQSNIMTMIRAIYRDDVILQRVMKAKKKRKRQTSINITRIEFKFELENCEIKNNLL